MAENKQVWGEEGKKAQEKSLGNDGKVFYFDCGDYFTRIAICQNWLNYTICVCSLWYFNYTSINFGKIYLYISSNTHGVNKFYSN